MSDDAPNGNQNEESRNKSNGRTRGGGNRGRGGAANSTRRPNSGRQNQNSRPQSTKVDMKKYERMISAAHTNFSDIPCGEKAIDCDICCKPNDVFGIGNCRHPVCVECAIRMRVLGNSKTCPVCRADVEILSFCTVQEDFSSVPLGFRKTAHPDEDRFGIRFSNQIAGKKYEKYLAHVCKICKTDDGERLEFPSFMSLRQHMANRHEQSYCHICTDNLNLFSRERKTYTRDQLQRHMKTGDFDDKSFKGHPQCLFCELKFLDEENRYRHLRKDHFFCQFCESDGTMTNVFFGKHDELKRHYKDNHYVCEVTECREMGIAFANKFELDLHRANEHAERRNLIELGFGQRPGPDVGRPGGRARAATRLLNDPALPVPRERIAMVQRQTETNPQSDPSEFTTVRSAQSKSTFINTRSNFTASQQDFPSLAPQAPPPSMRSSEFPRLNKVNKSSATAPASEPVEHFPSLGGSSAPPLRIKVPPLVKKRQPPPPAPVAQKPKPTSSRNHPRDEDDDYIPRRDVPQTVVKVNNALLRFDTVDDRVVAAAKSKIQMVQRVEQNNTATSSASAPSSGRLDFPSLPPASAPMLPANSSWLNSKNNNKIKSGVISSVSVPANYSKATQNQTKKKAKVSVPKTEVWSALGPAPEAATAGLPTDEWQTKPLSKEAQAEKERKERKEEWARKKAEIQARVAAATKDEKVVEKVVEPEQVYRSSTPPTVTPPAEPEWQVTSSKNGDVSKAAQVASNKKNKKNKKTAVEAPVIEKPKTPISSPILEDVPSLEPVKGTDALWNMPTLPSMTSMFSSFSLSGMFGIGSSSETSTPTAGPPPGLENVVLTPPPGLGFTSAPKTEDISFASVPLLTHDDVKQKRDALKQSQEVKKTDDGWTTTKTEGKKNKNKKK